MFKRFFQTQHDKRIDESIKILKTCNADAEELIRSCREKIENLSVIVNNNLGCKEEVSQIIQGYKKIIDDCVLSIQINNEQIRELK